MHPYPASCKLLVRTQSGVNIVSGHAEKPYRAAGNMTEVVVLLSGFLWLT